MTVVSSTGRRRWAQVRRIASRRESALPRSRSEVPTRMMLWFTTMPASAITPMPLMTMPKGWPVIIRPISTPMVDITTANRIRKLL